MEIDGKMSEFNNPMGNSVRSNERKKFAGIRSYAESRESWIYKVKDIAGYLSVENFK